MFWKKLFPSFIFEMTVAIIEKTNPTGSGHLKIIHTKLSFLKILKATIHDNLSNFIKSEGTFK